MDSDNAYITVLNALPQVYMTVFAVLVGIIIATAIFYSILALFAFRKALKQDTVYLAVTPPSFSHSQYRPRKAPIKN